MPGSINYFRTLSFLFGYEEWANRLLMGCLMTLVPFVGPIVVQGWSVQLMHRRIRGEEGLPEMNDFGGLIKDGIMPFLANMMLIFMVTMVLVLLYLVLGGIAMGVLMAVNAMTGDQEITSIVGMVMMAGGGLIHMVIIFFSIILMQVAGILVDVTGDFKSVFDVKTLWRLFKTMGKSLAVGMLVLSFVSPFMVILGYLACLIGIFPAMFVVKLAGFELRTQVYRQYLAAGYEPLATVSTVDGKPLTLGPDI